MNFFPSVARVSVSDVYDVVRQPLKLMMQQTNKVLQIKQDPAIELAAEVLKKCDDNVMTAVSSEANSEVEANSAKEKPSKPTYQF